MSVYASIEYEAKREAQLVADFKMVDKDGDGFISREELTNILRSGQSTDGHAEELEEIVDILMDDFDKDRRWLACGQNSTISSTMMVHHGSPLTIHHQPCGLCDRSGLIDMKEFVKGMVESEMGEVISTAVVKKKEEKERKRQVRVSR